jgi:colanic acid/amylovoran biosynthesis protein
MFIEIKGVQFVNKGAELMLQAVLQQLKIHYPKAKIVLKNNVNSPYLKRISVGAFQKLELKKNVFDFAEIFYLLPKSMRKYLLTWGIVTEADIDMVLDASGFSYGDQWSSIVLAQTAKEVKRMNQKGKKYVFLPQALGPFDLAKQKNTARIAFELASIVFARDEESLSHVKKVAPKANIIKAPDFTNLISGTDNIKYQKYAGGVAIIPNSKMLSRKNHDVNGKRHYIELLIHIINLLISKNEFVFLLNHEGALDYELCKDINSKLTEPLDIISPETALEVKGVIGHCKLTICSRFHGCVSSFSQGVPCIGTSWSHKYEQLFNEYGMQKHLVSSNLESDQISLLINDLYAEFTYVKSTIASFSKKYKDQSTSMWNKLFALE